MKKITWLFAIGILILSIGTFMLQSTPKTHTILDANGKPTQQLLSLLDILQLKHDGTLTNIVQETQKQWLRAAGKERWQVDEVLAHRKDELLPLFAQLGLCNEVKVSQKKYDYVLLLGATTSRMWTRLNYAIQLWNQGVRFDHIVLLGSERPLDPAIESPQTLHGLHDSSLLKRNDFVPLAELPKTEAQAFAYIFNQIALPDQMKSVPLTIIDSKMRTNPDNTVKRPTTGDTIFDWLAQQPKPGTCLLISNQPYVHYQDSVAKTFIPANWPVETVGQSASNSTRIVELLDTLARTLYQENIRLSAATK
jgi:hypothetical protein